MADGPQKLLHLTTVMRRYGRRGGSARKPPSVRPPLWRRAVDWVAPPASVPAPEISEGTEAVDTPAASDDSMAALTASIPSAAEVLTEVPTAEHSAVAPLDPLPSIATPEAASLQEVSIEVVEEEQEEPAKTVAPAKGRGPIRGGAAARSPDRRGAGERRPTARRAAARPAVLTPSRPRQPWIGIDFGNCCCTAGIFGERFEFFVGRGGEARLPSLLALASPNEVLVGPAALEFARRTGRPIVSGMKRLLGRRVNELECFDDGGLALVDEAGEITFHAHSRQYTVVDLCAMLLNVLRQRACRATGEEVSRVVLAVPATFGPAQRSALQAAANDAGLSVMGMLTEPSAALLGLGLRGRTGLALVCDFGSTFEFSLVELSEGSFTITAAGEDPTLGGEQVDRQLGELFADRFQRERGVDLREHAAAWQRLLLACSQAKQAAWQGDGARLHLELPELSQTMSYWLSRDQVQTQLDPLIDGTMELVDEWLGELKIPCPELCVVTGGLGQLAHVRERVARALGKEPISLFPSEAVLRGVALRAFELGTASAAHTSQVLPRKVGVALGQHVVTLFDRNTPLPAERRHTFFTDQDGQTSVELSVCLGDEQSRWQVLGQLRYRGLAPQRAGQGKVELFFELAEPDELQVSAEVGGKMHQQRITLGKR